MNKKKKKKSVACLVAEKAEDQPSVYQKPAAAAQSALQQSAF